LFYGRYENSFVPNQLNTIQEGFSFKQKIKISQHDIEYIEQNADSREV